MTKEQLQSELAEANATIEQKDKLITMLRAEDLAVRVELELIKLRINNLIKNDTNLLNSITKDNVNYNALERGLKQLNEIIKP